MIRIVFAICLVATPAVAAEFGWKCGDSSIRIAHVRPCPNGVPVAVDDMNAAELNAYTKALSEKQRKDELARKAAETRSKVEEDMKKADEYRVCVLFSRGPAIGMTEAQFAQCAGKGKPTSKNHTTTAQGRVTQYVYRMGNSYSVYYFRNGILTTIQD